MKDLIKNIGLVVLGFVILFLIYKWQMAEKNEKIYINNIKGKSDTLYVNKYLTPEKEYVYTSIPTTVIKYKHDTVRLDSVVIKDKIIKTYLKDTLYSQFNMGYLTNYPKSEKLIQLSLTNKNLDLSLVTLNGEVISKSFIINTENYNYLYTNNNLTFKNKFRLCLSAAYYIRPVVNMHDINIDLSVKTGKLQYIGGMNLFYYPNYKTNIGITPILGIKYNF